MATVGPDKTVQLWDAATGAPVGRVLEHQDHVVTMAFSPDGKSLLTGSYDKSAQLWDAAPTRSSAAPWT